ncbi:DNA-binding HxlR family transcriptional regulator [Clostridium acetobutylicum]|nr:DNA-binding HxlR family transcriptional regulator [Clostridium acetobutylicum]
MKIRKEYTCPLEIVHDMIKGKWKTIILWRLRLGKTSLSKLERDIKGITQKNALRAVKRVNGI